MCKVPNPGTQFSRCPILAHSSAGAQSWHTVQQTAKKTQDDTETRAGLQDGAEDWAVLTHPPVQAENRFPTMLMLPSNSTSRVCAAPSRSTVLLRSNSYLLNWLYTVPIRWPFTRTCAPILMPSNTSSRCPFLSALCWSKNVVE